LIEKLNLTHGINITRLDNDLGFIETFNNMSANSSHTNKTLLVVQNPSQQQRSELIDIQLPYYNFTIHELRNGTEYDVPAYDKYLPRTWLNSNKTMVRSMVQFRVDFKDPDELAKVFVITNLGVLRRKNKLSDYGLVSKVIPWNLNLPAFP
jgi:hypothetical protein